MGLRAANTSPLTGLGGAGPRVRRPERPRPRGQPLGKRTLEAGTY